MNSFPCDLLLLCVRSFIDKTIHGLTQNRTVSPRHISPGECFVVSCLGGEFDESVNNTELRRVGRRSLAPQKKERNQMETIQMYALRMRNNTQSYY